MNMFSIFSMFRLELITTVVLCGCFGGVVGVRVWSLMFDMWIPLHL